MHDDCILFHWSIVSPIEQLLIIIISSSSKVVLHLYGPLGGILFKNPIYNIIHLL